MPFQPVLFSFSNFAMHCVRILLCGIFFFTQLVCPATAEVSLHQKLQSYTQHPFFSESEVGIQVVNLKTMEEVFSHNADQHFIPASVMKALTASVALQELGPEYRFVTEIRYTGEITPEGVLKGNLYIIGSGDPYMNGEAIWKLIRNIKVAGVKSIQGGIYFDDSRYDGASYIPGWGKEVDLANGPSYYPMRSALNFNTNNIAIMVSPGTRLGAQARIQLEYPFSLVEIDNQVKTAGAGARSWIQIEREVVYEDESIVTAAEQISPVKKITYHIKGRIPINTYSPWVYYRSILEPEEFFKENFMEILKDHGIGHRGKVDFGSFPENSIVLAQHRSDPLRLLIADMNKYSRNLTAEMLLLELGSTVSLPAQTDNGLALIEDYLTRLGVWTDEALVLNGSGLSPTMQLQPSQVSAVMLDMYRDPLFAPEYIASMSVSGRDGTLKKRMKQEPYMARARGKTGSINGVYCVATYIYATDGTPYVMVFFANELRRGASFVRDLQNQIIQEIVDYSPDVVGSSR
jgi:D-alanyl-D-alanine carboxypeptidase/D-alanyl-D-alanine-endopeptidase (penicillin-binding protein 4)